MNWLKTISILIRNLYTQAKIIIPSFFPTTSKILVGVFMQLAFITIDHWQGTHSVQIFELIDFLPYSSALMWFPYFYILFSSPLLQCPSCNIPFSNLSPSLLNLQSCNSKKRERKKKQEKSIEGQTFPLHEFWLLPKAVIF